MRIVFRFVALSVNIQRLSLSLEQVIRIRAMSRQEIVALKLQMGISPTARIDPGVLLAMWRQLNRERDDQQRNRSASNPMPRWMTGTPFDV
jgi:hypothetical protein